MIDPRVIRGYLTPEDYTGEPADKLQKALNSAAQLDIRKVIIEKDITLDRTVLIPEGMHLIVKNATVSASGDFPLFRNTALTDKEASWSFEEHYFYLCGENGTLNGDVVLFNANYVTVEDLTVCGTLTFDFVRSLRVERVDFRGRQGMRICRGVNNAIIQHITANTEDTAVVFSTADSGRPYVVGKEADIHDVIFRDAELHSPKAAITMDATETETVFNTQIDHIRADGIGLEISGQAGKLPAESYFNLIAADFETPNKAVVCHSDTKHCILD